MGENRGSRGRDRYEQILLPVGRLIAKTGISANTLSVLSLLTAGVCTYLFWTHQLFWGIFFLLLTGFVDMLDGSVARAKGQSSHFGAVLDHTLDRYAEFLFLLGFGLGGYVSFLLIYFAFFSMIMASFVRAKAESVGGLESCAGIGIERKEKLTLLALGAGLTYWYPDLGSPWKNPLTIAVFLIAILSQLAAFLRLRYTYQYADHRYEGMETSKQGKHPFKVVVLDFDGTVADTMPVLEEIAVKLITKNYGWDPETARRGYIRTTGLPFFQQLELLFPFHLKNDKIAAKFEEEKLARFFSQPLFADVVETITQLRQTYRVCVSSSTLQPLVESYCQENKLIVDCILGYRPGFEKGKDHFDHIVKKFSLTYSDLIFIGDSLKDAERARSNNVAFIGKVGLFSEQEFQELGNIPTITSFKELLRKDLMG